MEAKTRPRPLAKAVMRAQPDDRLVALAREGREAAFEEIVRRYRGGLVPFAAAFAPSDRAEDVVQESLVRAWEALRTSESEIRLKPWLYTIVRNRALNARRDTRTHEQLDETIDGVRQPSEIVLTKEELAGVVAAVNALPEAQRKALVRSSLEGRTHEQLAAELKTSTGAVRQLIFRARAGLRESVGALLPLALVRALAETGMADASVTAAGGGALAAGSIGAVGGGSVAGKAAAVAATAAIVGGSGVAIDRASDPDDREQRPSSALSGDADPHGGGEASKHGSSSGNTIGGGSGPGDGSPGVQGGDDQSAGPGDGGSPERSGSHDGGSDDPSGSSGSGSGDDFDEPAGDDSGDDGDDGDGGGSGSGQSGREPEVEELEPTIPGRVPPDPDPAGRGSSGSGEELELLEAVDD